MTDLENFKGIFDKTTEKLEKYNLPSRIHNMQNEIHTRLNIEIEDILSLYRDNIIGKILCINDDYFDKIVIIKVNSVEYDINKYSIMFCGNAVTFSKCNHLIGLVNESLNYVKDYKFEFNQCYLINDKISILNEEDARKKISEMSDNFIKETCNFFLN